MFLTLQITFCILSALCALAVLPIGAFFGWIPALICVFGAVIFFMLTTTCKQAHLLRHPEDIIIEKQDDENSEPDDPAKNTETADNATDNNA